MPHSTTPAPRTVLHGRCLLNGKHRPGDPYATECPLLGAEARSERSKKAARTRWGRPGGGAKHPDEFRTSLMLGGGPEGLGRAPWGLSELPEPPVRARTRPE